MLTELYDKTLTGNGPPSSTGQDRLSRGLGPETMLYEALSRRSKSRCGSSAATFVLELLIAGKAIGPEPLAIYASGSPRPALETIGTV